MQRLTWIDMRPVQSNRFEILEEALHVGASAFLVDDEELVGRLPPTATVAVIAADQLPQALKERADILLFPAAARPASSNGKGSEGIFLSVVDEASLDQACKLASETEWLVVEFKQDPSKIPLEILLAAADQAKGKLVTVVADVEDAEVTINVLQRGPEGVLLAPQKVGDVTELVNSCAETVPDLTLEELEVVRLQHLGPGERVCVDTCSRMTTEEGILVGSYSTGMLLISSETHPLPYMPTRPFRVNAAAVHSYVVAPENRTRYLSELGSRSEILAVDIHGKARRVVVGRTKVETRPLLLIEARSAKGRTVNVIGQDDWHVRLLGPSGKVLNFTELKPGDRVLGYLPNDQRHVGYPIREYLHEQ